MLQIKRRDQITFLQSEVLGRVPGIIHAFSTRRGDTRDLNLGPHSSANPIVQMNRVRFLASVGVPGWPMMKLRQVHSDRVVDIQDTSAATDAVEGDAAVTALKGAVLAVQTADCVPILGEANRRQLINSGLREEGIEVSSLCTRCREDLFHSYRRDGKKMGHMLSIIGIVP